MVTEFLHSKGNHVGFMKLVPKNSYALLHGRSFYLLLISFRLQITHRMVRNLQIGVDEVVRKVLINLLHHVKFIMSHKVSHLCNQHNY